MTAERSPLRIALVGHCGPDSYALRSAVGRVIPGADLVFVNEEQGLAAEAARSDLLLINRALDGAFAEHNGVEMIRRLAGNRPALMLISNYPEAQAEAVAAGAAAGFGKKEMNGPRAAELLRAALAVGRGPVALGETESG